MFTQECFIHKNTKDLRSKLSSLGLKLNHGKAWGKYLCVFKTEDSKEWRYVASPLSELEGMPNYKNAIDCGDNEELFLAIAALRDDNDYMQWFVTEVNQSWVNIGIYSPKGSFELCLQENRYNKEWVGKEEFCSCVVPAHKATIEELIEHFKK